MITKKQKDYPKEVKEAITFMTELLQVKEVKKPSSKNPTKAELEEVYVLKKKKNPAEDVNKRLG